MYNAKIYQYKDSVQTRLYNKDFYSGVELKALRAEKKQLQRDMRQLEIDILHYFGKDLPDWFTENEYLEITESSYSAWSEDKKKKFIKTIASNRSKKAIYEISRSNKWDYFITLTFKRDNFDASNYDLCLKKVTGWLHDQRRKAPNLKYMVVPELHKDGINYHFHGLLANCGNIPFVESGHFTKNGDIIYNIDSYSWGFSEATKVKDTDKVSAYVSKYITKELESHIKGKRRYLASVNCERPDVIDLYLSDSEKLDFLINLDNIQHISSKSNMFNTVSYIEQKKVVDE